jgi:hypothetical protein
VKLARSSFPRPAIELANIATARSRTIFGIEKFQGPRKIGSARHS